MITKYLFTIFILLGIMQSALAANYKMEDLEVLDNEKNYREFLKHARDIPPRERNTHWKEMVQTSAEGLLKEAMRYERYDQKTFQFVEGLLLWPSIKNDEFFLVRRASFGDKFFSKCFSNQSNKRSCIDQAIRFWKNSPTKDPDLANNLANLLGKHDRSIDLWPFYSIVAKSKLATFLCKKDKVQDAIFNKLSSDLAQNELDTNDLKNIINNTVHPGCWTELSKKLKENLYSSSTITRDQSFTILTSVSKLGSTEEDIFLAYFILSGPTVGPIFNLSWNRIKNLALNYTRRQNVLSSIMKMDPLPGRTFSMFDIRKRDIILAHIYKNFPEYINQYAKTCLEYLRGDRVFPNGNPTIECRDLFKLSVKNKFLSRSTLEEYKKTSIDNKF